MPDDVSDQELAQALGSSFVNYNGPEGPTEEAPAEPARDPSQFPPTSEAPPAPQAAPIVAPLPVTPQAPVVPDVTAQQIALQDQQVQLTLQQQAQQGVQTLIAQGNDAAASQQAANNWMTQQWVQYQGQRVQQQQFSVDKQAAITKLAKEHSVDPAKLEPFNDIAGMTAAAQNYGEMSKLTAQVNPGPTKAPVQQMAGGTATPVASTQRAALDYVQGKGGVMTREQFETAFGYPPN